MVISLCDGCFQLRGHLGHQNHLLQLCAHPVQAVQIIQTLILQYCHDPGRQVIVIQEDLVGVRGNGKAGGDRQAHPVFDLPQVGVFFSHHVIHAGIQGLEVNHQGSYGDLPAAGEDFLHLLADAGQGLG